MHTLVDRQLKANKQRGSALIQSTDLVMKFSPWDQSAETAWFIKMGHMSIKIMGQGAIQAEIKGKNNARCKEIWSVTLAVRAEPVTQ